MTKSNIWQTLPHHFTALAPMEGVTDSVFRQVITRAGRPDLFFTEFTNVSSYASEKGRDNALERLKITDQDPPIIAQIWGKNPEHFAQTAANLENLGFQGLDINMGCPDRHVNRAGGGAAMIRTPDLAVECIKSAKTATSLPVSVKTRLGYTFLDEYQNWLPLLLNQHLAALTVHLRTRKEMSKVPAHYEIIPEIVKLRNQISPDTKLIINGDIPDLATAEKLWGDTLKTAQTTPDAAKLSDHPIPEIDGIMIGRGVFQNPYCFTHHQPTRQELLDLLNYHLDLFDAAEAELQTTYQKNHPQAPKSSIPHKPFDPLKRFFKVYLHDFPGASDLRAKLMDCKTTAEVRRILS